MDTRGGRGAGHAGGAVHPHRAAPALALRAAAVGDVADTQPVAQNREQTLAIGGIDLDLGPVEGEGQHSGMLAPRCRPVRSGDREAPTDEEEAPMADAVYKVTEVVGTSTESIHQAVRNAIDKAAQTLRNLDWFEVKEVRGHIENNQLGHFQVVVKLGFRME